MTFKNNVWLFFVMCLVCLFACEEAEDPIEIEPEPEKTVVIQYGTVSGDRHRRWERSTYFRSDCNATRIILYNGCRWCFRFSRYPLQ